MIFLKHMLPFFTNLIERIPNRPGKVIAWVLLVFMVFDIVISSAAIRRQTNRLGHPREQPRSRFPGRTLHGRISKEGLSQYAACLNIHALPNGRAFVF